MSLLTVQNLRKTFGGNVALDDVSFEIIPNKINLFIGSNGSGKTTLINVLSGIIHSEQGKVFLKNTEITNKNPHTIFNKGMIRTFQTPRLFHSLSVLENLLLADNDINELFRFSLFPKKWTAHQTQLISKATTILESLGLGELKNNLAYELSGGQIKLLELAKTLMSDSDLVLLDEPIAGINPTLAHKIFSKISKICKEQKTTFLIIEHRLDIALKYADYTFVMNKGKIIAHDKPDKILHNSKVIESYLE